MPYLHRGKKMPSILALKIIEGLAPLWMFERLLEHSASVFIEVSIVTVLCILNLFISFFLS